MKVRGSRFHPPDASRGPLLEGPSRYGPMGRSSGSRIILLAAPSHLPIKLITDPEPVEGQWHVRRFSSPVTAAGPRRIRTVFPLAHAISRIEHAGSGVKDRELVQRQTGKIVES